MSASAKLTEVLGRISAQTSAKQVTCCLSARRSARILFSEYSGRGGELVTRIVKRIEGQDLVADLGKTEARIPKKEQLEALESFSVGDRIRCVIKSVEKACRKNAGDCFFRRAAPELVRLCACSNRKCRRFTTTP